MRQLLRLIVSVFSCFSFISTVYAESLSVSLRVGDTRATFTGYSSPGAFITVMQNSTIVGTTAADSSGNWSKTIDADNPGIQTFELYATDTLGRSTIVLSYNLNLTANTETTLDNIVFPPTYTLTGDTLAGLSHPLSTISLMLTGGYLYSIPVSVGGTWTYTLTSLPPGSYTGQLIATMPSSYLSLSSDAFTYLVAGASPAPSSTTSPSQASTASTQSNSGSTAVASFPPAPSAKKPKASQKPRLAPPSINQTGQGRELFVTIARSILNLKVLLIIVIIYSFIRTYLKKKSKRK